MVAIPSREIVVIISEINLTFAEAALAALDARLADMTPVMSDLGEYLIAATKDRFKAGTAPDGAKWAPKSAATLQRYGARKSNRVDVRPLFGPTRLLSKKIFYEADARSVSWGSNLSYSAVMQFGAAKGAFGQMSNGSPIPWGNIPARPYIGISDEDQAQILATLEEWLEGAADTP